MASPLFDEIDNWANGVNTSAPADKLPPGASPRGRNTVLQQIGEDTALMGKRKGALALNSTPITGSPGLWGFQFKKQSGTKYNLLVSTTGRLDQLNSDTTTTVINATAFTSGTSHIPIFAVANDLCFIVNDVDQKKFDGTNVTKFGITRPAAPTATAVAGGAMAAGVWDVALTYFNSATGHESSRSDFSSVTLAAGNLRINVSWLAPTDTQVTHVRVYARQQTAGQNAYRAVAGATPAADATYGGYVPATLATQLDISATQYSAFTLLAPSDVENNPPASGLKAPVWHYSRMFLFDSGNLYYSKIRDNVPFPEAFDPGNYEPVNPNDGDTIVGGASFGGKLYIFKKQSIYRLVGPDPNSWQVELVTADYGCSSIKSVCFADGVMYWWAGALGMAAMAIDGAPVSLGKTYLGSLTNTVLNETGFSIVAGAVDVQNQTVLMAVPEFGSTRNTLIVPFSYRAKRFHAEWWNPFDVQSLWPVETSTGLLQLFMGGYSGQTFQWWAAGNDGIPGSTTTHGPALASTLSSTATTLTDSAAAFATTGGGLIERYVYAISQDRQTIQRRRITSNTATALTITPAWDNNPNTTYTYVVGGIDFQLDTPWMFAPTQFFKKRYEFLFLMAESIDIGTTVDVDLFVSNSLTAPKKTRTVSIGGTGGVYDAATSLYDTTKYAGAAVTFAKKRAGFVGRTWRARIRNCQADQDVLIYKVAMMGQTLGINS